MYTILFSVRDTFCSYSVMEMCVRELAPQILQLKEKGVNLSRYAVIFQYPMLE